MTARYAMHPCDDPAAKVATINRYLPSNYLALAVAGGVLIYGHDWHGYTLDGYVQPRLSSGWYSAKEIPAAEGQALLDYAGIA